MHTLPLEVSREGEHKLQLLSATFFCQATDFLDSFCEETGPWGTPVEPGLCGNDSRCELGNPSSRSSGISEIPEPWEWEETLKWASSAALPFELDF